MIKNDAIRTAAEIVKAQSQAAEEVIQNNGVLYCIDAKKGKYKILHPNVLEVQENEPRKLGEVLVELLNENSINKATIRSLQEELTRLKNEYNTFKANVIDVLGTIATTVTEADEEGDPL